MKFCKLDKNKWEEPFVWHWSLTSPTVFFSSGAVNKQAITSFNSKKEKETFARIHLVLNCKHAVRVYLYIP